MSANGTRRLRIRHTTQVSYAQAAVSSHNEVRMTPLTLPGQTTLDARVTIRPAATTWSYWDYWGTQVTAFELMDPHADLTITASSLVETSPPAGLPPSPAWAEITERTATSRLLEFAGPTVRTTVPPKLVKKARKAAAGLDPHETVVAVSSLVADRVTYLPGVTGVNTSAAEAWEQGAGVCQDIAHVTIALLRGLGLPTRYVSGYLHPSGRRNCTARWPGRATPGSSTGRATGTATTPRNRTRADESHVVVGRGRDYDDVTPHKGVYRGVAGGPPEVTVEFTRVA